MMRRLLISLLFLSLPLYSSFAQVRCIPSVLDQTSRTFDLRKMSNPTEELKNLNSNDLLLLDEAALSNSKIIEALKDSDVSLCLSVNRFSKSSELVAQNLLVSKFDDIKVVAVIPNTSVAIENVFEVNATSSMLKQMQSTNKQFEKFSNTRVISSVDESFLGSIDKAISESKNGDLLVFVGHNNAGRLMGPDGSSILISELNRKLVANRKVGIILSCETIK